MRILKGDTLYNTKTNEYGTAMSNAKKDGTVTVKLPSWKGSKPVQWRVEDVQVESGGF